MRIAFYAPLKSPDHPVPSGDRTMARALMAALRMAGHEVDLACRFRTRDASGTGHARRLALGGRMAERLARRLPRPDLWFTYHLYYKAPDPIGPALARRLGIPYVVAEASLAGKRARGDHAAGHRAVLDAVAAAGLVVGLNSNDRAAVEPVARRYLALKPFLDPAPFDIPSQRAGLAIRHGLDGGLPWLVAVGMMRDGDKLASYRVLAEAASRLPPHRLILVGDGPAMAEVASLFGGRALLTGRTDPAPWLASADLMVWPAINEAFGLALLEAQAAGLPVVAGASGGVGDIVAHDRTGLLVPPGDAAALAHATASLIADPTRRAAMGRAAREKVFAEHDMAAAARLLSDALARL